MRLGKNPALPREWITTIVEEACRLLEHLSRNHPFLLGRPQLQVLRQILAEVPLGPRRPPPLARR
ncbi:hypothetical protein ACFQ6Q_13795 [Streptomyces sp. NPDC056437]|uniref:hypothetical protein n=1 Tax=Streptomyces sp. NPDC056437 TaxID=3345816 RepID=UPI0036A64411